jgi:DNA-binding Lrp family transcriptional regulator
MKAFVLIYTELGFEEQIKEELQNINGVKNIYVVYGIYDIIVEIETESMSDIKKIVFNNIRTLKHIKKTVTLTTLEEK